MSDSFSGPARTRFAPSPTGFLHVGGVRTALFAWLVARKSGGQFILRIEDTDKVREVTGSIEHIEDSLRWIGIDWDEGPDKPGNFGPYVQSLRLDTYRQWAQKLVAAGRAYPDPYSPEELAALRDQAQAEKRPFLFREHRPTDIKPWDGQTPLRFLSEPKDYTWHDAVMGDMHAGHEAIDDFVLMKSDGYPTYNFCHIIDDHLMGVTHVIRSQEFVSSIPRFLNLYEALEIPAPVLATLPYVMAIDGKKKLSKRDGAKDILDYAREGYLPEAIMNFLATLGWNDGSEQEIFTPQELIAKFDLGRVQKSPARFDEQRLTWMSGTWMRKLPLDELYARSRDFWPASAQNYDDAYRKRVLALVQERLKFFAELPELTNFFFEDLPVNPELISGNKQLKKFEGTQLKTLLEQARSALETSTFTTESLTGTLKMLLETTGQKPGVLFSLIRVATTQAPASPGLADSLHVIGKDRSLARIEQQLKHLY